MASPAVEAAGEEVETFSGTPARWFGICTAAMCAVLAAGVLISDPANGYGMALFCAFLAALTWVVLIRPTATACRNGVLLRNMLRDSFVPWSRIERCKVLHTLQLVTADRHYHGVGVVRSTRSMLKAQKQPTSALIPRTGPLGGSTQAAWSNPTQAKSSFAQSVTSDLTYQDYIEKRIESSARDAKPDDLQPIVSWSWPAIGALLGAAACFAALFV